MVRLVDPTQPRILLAARPLSGVRRYPTRFVEKLVADGFPSVWVLSQRSNFLRFTSEQSAELYKHGLLTPSPAGWWCIKTAAIFHLVSFALAVLPLRVQKLQRTVSTKETVS